MPFSKACARTLLTPQTGLQDSAIEYQQLSNLIYNFAAETESLCPNPRALQRTECPPGDIPNVTLQVRFPLPRDFAQFFIGTKIICELTDSDTSGCTVTIMADSTALNTLRRLIPATTDALANTDFRKNSIFEPPESIAGSFPLPCVLAQEHTHLNAPHCWPDQSVALHEAATPLPSDLPFLCMLTAQTTLATALDTFQADFRASIHALGAVIVRASRPASTKGKSDLYPWREVSQLYAEAQVFESTSELDRGTRPVAESEARLALFTQRVGNAGVSFHIAESKAALQHFLDLNARLLAFKTFQYANAEALRELLARYGRRMALPLSKTTAALVFSLALGDTTANVSHALTVELTETLSTAAPRIDDYLCRICFALAFKPIRLKCTHLFCVRCLVKLQKQGKDNCPLCRAATVTVANESNVDYAMINFMRDWFPKETTEKAKANDRESAQEEMEELGLDTRCVIM